MNLKHTNISNDIQNEFDIEYDKIEMKQIKEQSIEVYINNLYQTFDIVSIHKMISYIDIILSDFELYDDQQKDNIRRILKQSGFIAFLIILAKKQISPQLTTILTNFLTINKTKSFISQVVHNGGIQLFQIFLESKVEIIQQAAIQGLGYISSVSKSGLNIIYISGTFELLIKKIKSLPQLQYNTILGFGKLALEIPIHQITRLSKCMEAYCHILLHNEDEDIYELVRESLLQFVTNPKLSRVILKNLQINNLVEQINCKDAYIVLHKIFNIVLIEYESHFFEENINQLGFIKKILQTEFLQKVLQILKNQFIPDVIEILHILQLMTEVNEQSINQILSIEEIIDQLFIQGDSEEMIVREYVAAILNKLVTKEIQKNKQFLKEYKLILMKDNMKDIQFLITKGLFRVYKTILQQEQHLSLIFVPVLEGIITILETVSQEKENDYLIELKKLEIDKLIQSFSIQDLNSEEKELYNRYIELLIIFVILYYQLFLLDELTFLILSIYQPQQQ